MWTVGTVLMGGYQMSTCLKLGGKEMDKALKEMMYSKIIVEMKEVVKKGGDVLQYLSELRGDHKKLVKWNIISEGMKGGEGVALHSYPELLMKMRKHEGIFMRPED